MYVAGTQTDRQTGRFNYLAHPPPNLHSLLNNPPNPLDDLTIHPPPSTMDTTAPLIPPFDGKLLHAAPPALDLARRVLAAPSDIDPRRMLEQLRRRRPLVRLELPRLACREDGHQPRPVLRAEVRCAVDKGEAAESLAAAAAAGGGLRGGGSGAGS